MCFTKWVALLTCVLVPDFVKAENQWADLQLRVTLAVDKIPEMPMLEIALDKKKCGSKIEDERLLIDPLSKGVRNTVLYVYDHRGGLPLNLKHPTHDKRRNHEILLRGCRIDSRVTCAAVRDTVTVRHKDSALGHNLNFPLLNNPAFIPPGGNEDQVIKLAYTEPVPTPIQCNIHPWMKGFLLVLDHRYAGVSDGNGVIVIENLPVGETLSFRLFHESVHFSGLLIGDNPISERNLFTETIREGLNDLGEIRVPLEAIKHGVGSKGHP